MRNFRQGPRVGFPPCLWRHPASMCGENLSHEKGWTKVYGDRGSCRIVYRLKLIHFLLLYKILPYLTKNVIERIHLNPTSFVIQPAFKEFRRCWFKLMSLSFRMSRATGFVCSSEDLIWRRGSELLSKTKRLCRLGLKMSVKIGRKRNGCALMFTEESHSSASRKPIPWKETDPNTLESKG